MTAEYSNTTILCVPNGKTKKQRIHVGDIVDLSKNKYGDNYVVESIEPRRNMLLRPPLANLDQLFIIVSKTPQTDYLLVDKLIIYCLINNIIPYIIINKCDLYEKDEIEDIINQYNKVVKSIIVVSARNQQGVDKVRKLLQNKVSAFAGQSAVGKSTLLNAIEPTINQLTNGLSKKISRGKHTTRYSEIFLLSDNIKIADTPGFSMLDFDINIEPEELSQYYPDMELYKCKYTNCDHTNLQDKDCAVAKAVISAKINYKRYDRYIKLYSVLREKWRKKYD